MSNTTPSMPMDINEIRALLPHRYPFLLIDRVVELEPGKRVRCYKSVSVNEPFFQGHFPARPVMPGVLVIEALAQAGGVLSYLSTGITGRAGNWPWKNGSLTLTLL